MKNNEIAPLKVSTEQTKIHASAVTSLNVGLTAELFGIKLMGIIDKDPEGVRVLVAPGFINEPQRVSLDTICTSANISQDTKTAIDSALKEFLGFAGGLKDTIIDVNQAFFYYTSHAGDIVETLNKEYALSLKMTNEYTSPVDAPFKINNVSFSLWNSTRQSIIESLGAVSVGEILKKYS